MDPVYAGEERVFSMWWKWRRPWSSLLITVGCLMDLHEPRQGTIPQKNLLYRLHAVLCCMLCYSSDDTFHIVQSIQYQYATLTPTLCDTISCFINFTSHS